MTADPATLYGGLRKAVASDVKRARRDLAAIRLGPEEVFQAVLDLASRPGEGRVRQMVATAARIEQFAGVIEPWLRRWLEVESDEFARSAILAALPGKSPAAPERTTPVEMPLEFVEAYRFVSERLCHRVRNALMGPRTTLVLFEQYCERLQDESARTELLALLSRLRPDMQRISRMVEFDTDDGYLAIQPVTLGDWLNVSKPRFAPRYGNSEVVVIGTDKARRARVLASQFLLDTIFGNLWANSVQACEAGPQPCQIVLEINANEKEVDVLVRDSGPGFTPQMAEVAFRHQYSTNAESRGRGLLEVADAVRRLQGEVKLVPVADKRYRVLVRFPREQT